VLAAAIAGHTRVAKAQNEKATLPLNLDVLFIGAAPAGHCSSVEGILIQRNIRDKQISNNFQTIRTRFTAYPRTVGD
jgi:hypothetical protein